MLFAAIMVNEACGVDPCNFWLVLLITDVGTITFVCSRKHQRERSHPEQEPVKVRMPDPASSGEHVFQYSVKAVGGAEAVGIRMGRGRGRGAGRGFLQKTGVACEN